MTTWWLDTVPPVPGILRAVFYGGLLIACLLDHPSPLDAPKLMAKTGREFYTPVGALRVLGLSWVDPRVLRVIRWATIVCWVAAAAGFAQPVSGALTFVGFAFLHAVNAGALGSNHSTHAALFALFSMSFSVSHDAASLDAYLSDHVGMPLLVGPDSVLTSGFAPQLLLVFLAYIMFAGGVSKVRHGGTGWLTGKSLWFYIDRSAPFARAPWLSRALLRRLAVLRVLACATVVIELAAPAALVFPAWRTEFVLAWIALHIGILLVMMPAYWIQMWCYLLVVDWTPLRGVLASDTFGAAAAAQRPGATALAVLGSGIGVVLLLALLRRSEQWPCTSVPMYSNGTVPDEYKLPSPAELPIRARKAASGDLSAWHRPWVPAEALEDIEIVPANGDAAVSLFDVVSAQDVRFVRWSQFAKVVRDLAIADLAVKDPARPDAPGVEFPAARFLADLVPFVDAALPDPSRYRRIQLACLTTAGWFPVATAQLSAGSHRTAPYDRKGLETP